MITFITVLSHHLQLLFVAHVKCSSVYALTLHFPCGALDELQGASRQPLQGDDGTSQSQETLQRGAWLQYRDAKRALQKHFS